MSTKTLTVKEVIKVGTSAKSAVGQHQVKVSITTLPDKVATVDDMVAAMTAITTDLDYHVAAWKRGHAIMAAEASGGRKAIVTATPDVRKNVTELTKVVQTVVDRWMKSPRSKTGGKRGGKRTKTAVISVAMTPEQQKAIAAQFAAQGIEAVFAK